MRVGFVVEQLLSPVPGGTGRYTAELGRALAETASSPDEVRSYSAWHRRVAPGRIPGVQGPTRLALPRPLLARAWEQGWPPRVAGVDLVHAPTPLAPVLRAGTGAALPRPLVVTVHDAVPWSHPETLTGHGAQWHRRMVCSAVAAGAVIAVPTRAVAAELAAVLPGLSADRLAVLGGGVSPALLDEPEPGLPARLTARWTWLAEPFVLSLATLEPRKGLDVLIAAMAALGPAAPRLVLVGQPGWGGVDVPELARRAGLSRVVVAGRLPDDELGVVLRAARVLVMPSRAEGFGLPLAEAMALGTPVICTDVPALVEVAGDGALVVPRDNQQALSDCLAAVAADDRLCAEQSRRGLGQADRHTWRAVADRAWALYRTLTV